MVTQKGEFAEGWRVVAASMLGVGLGMSMLINTAGLFVIPMQREFGWTRSALAIGPMVGITYALLLPFAGLLIDRVGARKTAIGGSILLAIGFALLAIVPPVPILFYGLVLYLSIASTVTGNVVYARATASWFTSNLGTAIALVLSGVSIAGAAAQPVLASVIERHGWRYGYALLSVLVILVLPLLLVWLREKPSANPRGPATEGTGATVREALADSRFWLMIAAFGGAAFPIGGFVNQFMPLLRASGYAVEQAAGLMSVFLILTAVGRLLAGALFDRLSPRIVAGAFFFAAAGGAAYLASVDFVTTPWLVVALAIGVIGLAQGAEGDFIALFTLRVFGMRRFSTLFAILVTGVSLCFALGGLFFTAIFDRMNSYSLALVVSTAVLFASSLLALTIRLPAPGEAT